MPKKLDAWYYDPHNQSNWQDDETLYEWIAPVSSEPTTLELEAAHTAYQDAVDNGSVLLEANKTSIVGNNVDSVIVTVTLRTPYPDFTILYINGEEVIVPFDPKGVGAPYTRQKTITLTCDTSNEDIIIAGDGNILIIEVT